MHRHESHNETAADANLQYGKEHYRSKVLEGFSHFEKVGEWIDLVSSCLVWAAGCGGEVEGLEGKGGLTKEIASEVVLRNSGWLLGQSCL